MNNKRMLRSRVLACACSHLFRRFVVGVNEPGAIAQPGPVGERPHVLRHHQPGPAFAFTVTGVDGGQRPAPTPQPQSAPSAPPSHRRRRWRRGVGLVVHDRWTDVVVQTATDFGSSGGTVLVVVHAAPPAPAADAVGRWRSRDVRVGNDDGRGGSIRGRCVHDDATAVRAGQQQLPRAGRGRL